ncbi:MAG: C1 family peptidase [Bacteroidetes bacterium]|nr:C1 family peptidase [Bacteroidota bacterium]
MMLLLLTCLGFSFDLLCQSTFNPNDSIYKTIPQSVDLRPYMTPVKNQGDRNTCFAYAAISLMEFEYKRMFDVDVDLSEEYLIYLAKSDKTSSLNEDDNMVNTGNKMQQGFLLEEDYPYQPTWFAAGYPCEGRAYDGSDSTVDRRCFSHDGPDKKTLRKAFKVEFPLLLDTNFELSHNIEILAKEQKPIVFLFPCNVAEKDWPSSGKINYSDTVISPQKENCQLHFTVLCGYDLNAQVFYVRNSWGKDWGENGYGTLSFDDFYKFAWSGLWHIGEIKERKLRLPKRLRNKL